MSSTAPSPSNRPAARAYWAVVVGLVFLCFAAPAIPTQDGPSHRYNLTLIAELLGDAPPRSKLHRLAFESPTNLGFIAVGLPLSAALPSWAVERAVIALHILLIAIFSTWWLRECGRRVYPTAFAGLAFALPWSLFMGFYSYQLGADLALLSVCLTFRLRQKGFPTAAAVSWVCGAVVLAFHAVAAALLVGLLALVQLTDFRQAAGPRLLRAGAIALPLLAAVLYSVSAGPGDSKLEWRDLDYILLTLATFGTLTFSTQLLTCLLLSLGIALLCLPGQTRRSWDWAAAFSLAAVASLALLHLVAPDFMGGGGYLTGRFAWWIPLLALPLLNVDPLARWDIPRSFIAVAMAAMSLGSTLISAAPSARLVAEVETAARHNPVQGSVAAALFTRTPLREALFDPLRHVAAHFVVEHGVLVTNYQARVPFFPLRFTPEAEVQFPHIDINQAWLTDWGRLPITALVTVGAEPDDRRTLRLHFNPAWRSQSERVELWRRH